MSYALGFIGFGKMAQAIWNGLLDAGYLTPQSVCFVEKSPERARCIEEEFGLTPVSLQTLIESTETILIAIKPQQLSDLFPTPVQSAKATLVISILAGTPLSTLATLFPTMSRCRVMPNTPALVGECMSGISFCETATATQVDWVMDMFSCIGKAMLLPESELDLVTGISGSGPAFFYQLAIYVRDYAKAQGLTPEDALTLVSQTMIGAGRMLQESGSSPETLIHEVSSPNGTTVKGLETMNNSAIETDFTQVIDAARKRSIELKNAAS